MKDDPRIKVLFNHLRQAIDIIEDIVLHPHTVKEPIKPIPLPTPIPVPSIRPDHPLDAVSFKDLKILVTYSRAHIDRLEKAGKFPKRFYLGPGRVVWWKREVLAWLEEHANKPRT